MKKPMSPWVRFFLPFSTFSGLLAPVRIVNPEEIITPRRINPASGITILMKALTMSGRLLSLMPALVLRMSRLTGFIDLGFDCFWCHVDGIGSRDLECR